MTEEVFVCLRGVWIEATWDDFKVGVWIESQWYNMASFDAYSYAY